MATCYVCGLSSGFDNALVDIGNHIFLYYWQKPGRQNRQPIIVVFLYGSHCTNRDSGWILFPERASSMAGSFFLGLDFISDFGFSFSRGEGLPADSVFNSNKIDAYICYSIPYHALLARHLHGKS